MADLRLVQIGRKLCSLLCSGAGLKDAASACGLSYFAARRLALRYEREGFIERTARRPGIYRRRIADLHQSRGVREFAPATSKPEPAQTNDELPIMLPAKFGATFHLASRPAVRFNAQGNFWDKQPSRTVRLGRHKMQVWLHAFRGRTVDEIVNLGKADLLDIGQAQGKKYGVIVVLDRFFYDWEWVDTSKERSAGVAEGAGIADGGARIVAGAVHKSKDWSHPDSLQFNPLTGGDEQRPTVHAKIHEYVYSGGLGGDLEGIGRALKRLDEQVQNLGKRKEG